MESAITQQLDEERIRQKMLSLPRYDSLMTHDTALRNLHLVMLELIQQSRQNVSKNGLVEGFADWFDQNLFTDKSNPRQQIKLNLRDPESGIAKEVFVGMSITPHLIKFSVNFDAITGIQSKVPYDGTYPDIANVLTKMAMQRPTNGGFEKGNPPYDHLIAQDILAVIQGKMPTHYTSNEHVQFFCEVATLFAFESSPKRDPSFKQFGVNLLLLDMIAKQQTYGQAGTKKYLFCNSFDSAVKIKDELKFKRTEDKEKEKRKMSSDPDHEPTYKYKVISPQERASILTLSGGLEGDIIGGKSPASTKSPNKVSIGMFEFNKSLDSSGKSKFIYDSEITRNRVLMKQAKLLFYWQKHNKHLEMSESQQDKILVLMKQKDETKSQLDAYMKSTLYQQYLKIVNPLKEKREELIWNHSKNEKKIEAFNKQIASAKRDLTGDELVQKLTKIEAWIKKLQLENVGLKSEINKINHKIYEQINHEAIKAYRRFEIAISKIDLQISNILCEKNIFKDFFVQLFHGQLQYPSSLLTEQVESMIIEPKIQEPTNQEKKSIEPPTKVRRMQYEGEKGKIDKKVTEEKETEIDLDEKRKKSAPKDDHGEQKTLKYHKDHDEDEDRQDFSKKSGSSFSQGMDFSSRDSHKYERSSQPSGEKTTQGKDYTSYSAKEYSKSSTSFGQSKWDQKQFSGISQKPDRSPTIQMPKSSLSTSPSQLSKVATPQQGQPPQSSTTPYFSFKK